MLCSPKPDFGLILAAPPEARMAHYARPGHLARSSKPALFIHREWLRNIKPGNFSQDYLFAQYLSSETQTSSGSAQESGNFYRCRFSMRRPLTDIPRAAVWVFGASFLLLIWRCHMGHRANTGNVSSMPQATRHRITSDFQAIKISRRAQRELSSPK